MSAAAMPPPDGDDESATPILRNMSSRSIPLVPPMDDETASARSANAVDGWPSRSEPAASLDATSSAPRFMVRPQSPSPTMVSYLVRSGSASASAAEQAASAARARSAKFSTSTGGSCAGPDAVPGAAAAATSGISDDDGRALPFSRTSHPTQAGAVVSLSNSATMSSVTSLRGSTDTLAPCMSKLVMKLPTSTLLTTQLSASSSRETTDRARRDISKLLVPPRLFTRTSSSSPFPYSGTTLSPSGPIRP
mmetsp:Transcript_20718/g.48658  ORF Transcript_20718/g.48658 Transcript_20718/m.48658 type:complete len:250 (+) Transcript_20718:414-1163(+)